MKCIRVVERKGSELNLFLSSITNHLISIFRNVHWGLIEYYLDGPFELIIKDMIEDNYFKNSSPVDLDAFFNRNTFHTTKDSVVSFVTSNYMKYCSKYMDGSNGDLVIFEDIKEAELVESFLMKGVSTIGELESYSSMIKCFISNSDGDFYDIIADSKTIDSNLIPFLRESDYEFSQIPLEKASVFY